MVATSTACDGDPNYLDTLPQLFYEDCKGFPLVPYMSHGFANPVRGGKVVSDALMPSEYRDGKADWVAADFKK